MQKFICIEFDGVIHSYKDGWRGPEKADDEPVMGAIDFLKALIDSDDIYSVAIHSSRSIYAEGIACMKAYLLKHGLAQSYIDKIEFPATKPSAFLTIDARCYQFHGQFPSILLIRHFAPWYQQRSSITSDPNEIKIRAIKNIFSVIQAYSGTIPRKATTKLREVMDIIEEDMEYEEE